MALIERRTVATLLQHPGCTSEPREFLLERFEELVFHDGRHVYLIPESDDKRSQSTPATPVPEPSARRFSSIHDAAVWIAQNWPDFDLEATTPVTWYGQ